MARTLINGSEQLQAGTIPWAAMASGAIVPTASLVDGAKFIKSDGTVSMTASLAMGGNTITGLGSPVNTTDAVTKLYVDTKISGFEIFEARLMSATNVATRSGLLTVDGVVLVAGNIVLLTAQTTGSQNGPWLAASGAWTRPTWWASGSTVPEGAYFLLGPDGTTYGSTKWWLTNVGAITVDTTATAFAQDLSGTNYTAGAGGGLTLGGTAFSVNTGNGITITSNNVTAVGTGLISVGASGIQIANSSSNGQMILGNASNVATWTSLSGDAALSAAGALTLNTVNSNVGSFGASNAIPTFTVNAKGLITAASTAAVIAPASTLTGATLASNVLASSLTSLGTLSSLSVSGTTTLTGVTTLTAAPVLTALTGFVYANGASAATASATLPSTALNLSANEIPTGACNGANTAFTLAHTPLNSSLEFSLNGVLLRPGASYDYTVSAAVVTMNFAPAATDYVAGSYFY